MPAAGLRTRIGTRPGDGGAKCARQEVAHGYAAHARFPENRRQPCHVRSHLHTNDTCVMGTGPLSTGNHGIMEGMFRVHHVCGHVPSPLGIGCGGIANESHSLKLQPITMCHYLHAAARRRTVSTARSSVNSTNLVSYNLNPSRGHVPSPARGSARARRTGPIVHGPA